MWPFSKKTRSKESSLIKLRFYNRVLLTRMSDEQKTRVGAELRTKGNFRNAFINEYLNDNSRYWYLWLIQEAALSDEEITSMFTPGEASSYPVGDLKETLTNCTDLLFLIMLKNKNLYEDERAWIKKYLDKNEVSPEKELYLYDAFLNVYNELIRRDKNSENWDIHFIREATIKLTLHS